MADRIRIYTRNGRGLCDVRATAERTWTLNQEGEAEFDLVTMDPACREDVLRFGNWVLIENDKLEPWVGMIDVPQEWKRRYVHVHAYTPERQLLYRDVPRTAHLAGKSGNLFAHIFEICNRQENTVLTRGNVWMGGKDYPDENWSGDSLADYLQALCERSNAFYSFRPVTLYGSLLIYANWSQVTGPAVQDALVESYNVEDKDNSYLLQDEFRNELWGYGKGAKPDGRPTARARDTASWSKYGLRQGNESYSDYNKESAVAAALQSALEKKAWPTAVFELGILDVGNTWGRLRNGYTYPLSLWSVGWGVHTSARIESMYFDPARGKVDVKATEV